MQYQVVLKKMITEQTNPINYYLFTKNNFINVNQLIGKQISISFIGYECLCCGKDKKIFRQGFCYDCFYSSASVGDWIMKPELSKAHLNIEDRDLTYEKKVQLQPHVVYLAYSGTIKVGVTRKTQIPTRWIDQGATQAIEILEAPNRYLAGITEVALKEFISDKTSWQKMLKSSDTTEELLTIKQKAEEKIPEEAKRYFLHHNTKITQINYPVKEYPTKINSLNLNKNPSFKGELVGIKGQYLIFKNQTVFNVRANEGYRVSLKMYK